MSIHKLHQSSSFYHPQRENTPENVTFLAMKGAVNNTIPALIMLILLSHENI